MQQRFVTVDLTLLEDARDEARRAFERLDRFVERLKAASAAAADAYANGAQGEQKIGQDVDNRRPSTRSE